MKKEYVVKDRNENIMVTCSSHEVASEYALEYRQMFNLKRPNDVRVLVRFLD